MTPGDRLPTCLAVVEQGDVPAGAEHGQELAQRARPLGEVNLKGQEFRRKWVRQAGQMPRQFVPMSLPSVRIAVATLRVHARTSTHTRRAFARQVFTTKPDAQDQGPIDGEYQH